MPVTRVAYCSREQVKRALDVKQTARSDWQIDRAIQSSARNIEGHLHRRFYPEDGTKYFDWPNFQYAYPWRIWFDQWDLAVPVSVTTGGTEIPLEACNFGPVNSGPPFTYLELRRDLNYSFGVGSPPQRDVALTGTWGYGADTDPAGQLATSVTAASTAVTVTDGGLVGVGNLLIVDGERMLITDRSNADTGQTIAAGGTTAQVTDVAITVQDGTQIHVDEVLQVDAERMLVVDVTGNTVTVKRAWDGSVLATHALGAAIYASRALTVARGQYGTTAAAHASSAAAAVHRVPSMVQDLAIAESENRILQEPTGYAEGGGEGAPGHALGAGLADLWDEVETAYGRKNRIRVI
jgi:hypothetical protein